MLLTRSKFISPYVDSLKSQYVDLSEKTAVQNDGCIFTHFCGGCKNNFWL